MKVSSRPLVRLVCLIAATGAAVAASADWPQFRGAGAQGRSESPGLFEAPSGVGLQVAWRAKIGSGYSGLAIAGGRVVAFFTDGTSDIAAAFDEATGKELWRRSLGPTEVGHDGSHDGPLSTPLIAGDRVIVLGGQGRLVALRSADGTPLWTVDLVERFAAQKPFYGFSTSPILAGGVVVVETGVENMAIAGFDPATGETRWTVGADTVQYQTPAVVSGASGDTVLAAGDTKLFAIEPATGRLIWEYAHEGGGGGYGAPSLTPVSAGEGRLFLAHKDDASRVVRVERDGDGYRVEPAWENNSIRGSYNVPVYHDGFLYAFSSRFLTCVDAASGEVRWRSREPGDGWLALADRHLVVVTKTGSVHVVEASPEGYREVAALPVLDDLAWSPPGIANGHVFVRSLGEIARVDIGPAARIAARVADPAPAVPGSGFGVFLEQLARAENRTAAVDAFLETVPSFPLVEGDRAIFLWRGQAADVAVAGDPIGMSQERPMERVPGTDLFWMALELDRDARVNYRFIVDYEEVVDPRNPRRATTTMIGRDMELSFGNETTEFSWFSMPEWKAPGFLGQPDEARRGRVETREFESASLEKKLPLEVYLPAGYDGSTERYPVVFVHNGAGAVKEGQWPVALDNLIGTRVEPLIAVFIPQAGVQVPRYVPMFAKELLPWVDANFRTRPEAAARANVGMGFGGNTAFFCTFSEPGLVGKLATQSAFLFEFAWIPLQPMVRTAAEQPLDIYLDWGAWDLHNPLENWDIARSNADVDAYLVDRGYSPTGGEVHDGSDWSSWRNRTDALLAALFPLRKAR